MADSVSITPCQDTVPSGTNPTKSRKIVVFDCRLENNEASEKVMDVDGMDFSNFVQTVSKEYSISTEETFILATTDRMEIDASRFDELKDGSTLHLLRDIDQVLPVSTQERIVFIPHYDTLIQSGMYEYYASEGQKSLPYALAELIDNALSATSKNADVRTIEIRLLFDESQGRPAVVVVDNGCGMTSKQLNNWAVYRLSKFTRENSDFESDHTGYIRPSPVPRSLNSDISYFGVGGKQAIFYIGQSVRMITKPAQSLDVHELVLSKEDFEKKDRNKEEIYSTFILNRKPGDFSHISSEEDHFLHGLVAEETGRDSFTAVVVTAVQPEHIAFLKSDFSVWTRELAHMYHYYIHGPHGNNMPSTDKDADSMSNIEIKISLLEKSKPPRIMKLREVDDDMQTLYINSSADTFEFRAHVEGDGVVEGLIRYHPFLYDKETYPKDLHAVCDTDEEEDDDVLNRDGRGKKPLFECFWNGRLIPYTTVAEFDWCARPKKTGPVPSECFNRISGVLFTNDRFQVSTNKLTFMDLELLLKNKGTIFTRVVKGQEQRVKIQREFTQWMKNCHEKLDKQVKFMGFQGITKRTDVPTKKLQTPWATFTSIEWDGKTYKTGQYIKSVKTLPIFCGTVVQFLLYGDYEGDVYATGGQVQVALEPKALFDEVRTIPISKIDKGATTAAIKKVINEELAKLPDKLKVTWPEGNEWAPNAVHPAGTHCGPIQVEILSKRGESMTRMPVPNHSVPRKLLMELKVIWHSPTGDVETNSHISQHGGKWPYWFKTMENLSRIGEYTLHLQAVLNESDASECAGRLLPSHRLHFSICEGDAETFTVRTTDTPLRVGLPFDILAELLDKYGHPTQPPPDLKPVLECSALEMSYEGTTSNGTTFTIAGVIAKGLVKNCHGKTFNVKVILLGLKRECQPLKITLLPGLPFRLKVKPDSEEISVESGTSVTFRVEVQDEAGNITAHPELIVQCQFEGAADMTMEEVDCSNSGSGVLVSKPLCLKNVVKDQPVKVKFDLPTFRNIEAVEKTLKITPSTRIDKLEIFSKVGDDLTFIKDGEKIDWTAGDILDSLHFRLLDEGNHNVPLTASIVKNIQVNWRADPRREDLAKGRLPILPVPVLVKEEHFYQVSFQDRHVSALCSFIIMPHPGEPKRMKATLKCEASVEMGEVLPGEIYLEASDQYGNKTPTLTAECISSVGVSAEGLDKSCLEITWQESTQSVVIQGIRFLPGVPGCRELCLAWRDFVEFVRINVSPGRLKQLQLVDGPEEPLQVFNGGDIEKPLVVQLCDEWGNPSSDQRVLISLKASTADLKMKCSPLSQPANMEGRASFCVKQVTAPKGEYRLEFGAVFNDQSILGPVLNVRVVPDPNKPLQLLVEYDANSVFPAGGFLTVFAVTVVSEDGSAIRNLNPASISMLMWKGESTGPRPPPAATTLKCSKPKDDEKDTCFYFRDKIIPDRVGKYTVQFVFFVEKTKSLWSHQYVINVVPNSPVKLMPEFQPPTPVVSNSRVATSRTLVQNLLLKVMDEYHNPAGTSLDGEVVVSFRSACGDEAALPLFEGKAQTATFSLNKGLAEIKDLAVMENCPGTDRTEYILHFEPRLPGIASGTPLRPFELPFMFYNDCKNQEQIVALTKKKDRLSQSIIAYRSLFDTNSQLVSELKDQLQDATNKELHLKSELRKCGVSKTHLATVESVDALIAEKTAEQDRILGQARRTCTIPNVFKSNPDVLGKIGHLAQIEDDNAAKVISWHLSGDMDCVVTKTITAARQIYDDTQGRQQVMPLDTVFWRNTNRPLPHIRNGSNSFTPVGNPVYARDLLVFPDHAESCQIVFGNLLGDTILVDDLDAANHYRKGVVQSKWQCPTLLSRQGERIRSNGKFGGLQNKAPPIEKLRGQVFGAPLPKEFCALRTQIELLQQCRVAMVKCKQVKDEYEAHMEHLQSPGMVEKEEELKAQEEELKEIEIKLGTTPTRRMKGSVGKRVKPEPREASKGKSKRRRVELRSQLSGVAASPSMGTRRRTS